MGTVQDESPEMNYPEGRLVVRLLLSFATALVVFVTAYFCAWRTFYMFHGLDQQLTRQSLIKLRDDIEKYKETHGKLPERLEDLDVVKKGFIRQNDAGQAVDGWRHPFAYEVDDGEYRLFSYGRDGEPGGEGLDADLYPGRHTGHITLWQYATYPGTFSIFVMCALAGLIAFPICLLQGREVAGEKSSLLRILWRNGLTALFAVVVAVMIGVPFLQSGH
jgi:Type II secretion system (T2SS), protein G